MKFEGIVEAVLAPFSAGNFRKREVVMTDGPESGRKYARHLVFTFKNDKADQLDHVNQGDRIEVEYDLDGRKWDGPKGTRYFVELPAWKLVHVSPIDASEPTPPETEPAPVDDDAVPF